VPLDLDAAARKLGMTPDAIRRKNFITPRAMPYKTATGKVYDSGDFTAHMKRAMEIAGWKEFPRRAKAAKKQGLAVTCEVTPHHFTLIDEDVIYDTRYKMNPPLASREDREALLTGLADGAVDAIGTDHAPHHPASKDVEFDRAPFGITGFETALSLALAELVHTKKIPLMRLVELFTTGPARVLGIERKIAANEPADLTIFSTDQKWTFHAADSASKSRNSPFDGREFRGAPMATIVNGKIVWRRETAASA